MSLIISKRSLLKGMFAAPALVAISSIMPVSVKAFERATALSSYGRWCLVSEFGKKAWMKESDVATFINPLDIIKTIDMPIEHIIKNKTTVELMKAVNAPVVWEIPYHFTKSLVV